MFQTFASCLLILSGVVCCMASSFALLTAMVILPHFCREISAADPATETVAQQS
jgi:hypothetical protein